MWSESVARRAAASELSASADGIEQVGVGALARAPDPAADLVGLGEAELVGALDDQRVRLRDVEARLDDRRRHQAVGVAAQELEHRSLELGLVHLPVGLGEANARAERPQALGDLVQRLDPVVEEEGLAAALDLALDRPAHQLLVVGADVGADRPPALGRRLDHRDVAQPGEAHLQGPRDRRRRHRQHVDLELQLAQELLLADPEALLLVDDQQPQLGGADVAREQPVGADQDVDLAVGEARQRRADLGRACEGARPSRPRSGSPPGARGRCRGAAGRGSSSAPASSPACRRRRPCGRRAARPRSCRSRRRRRSAGPSGARTPCRP